MRKIVRRNTNEKDFEAIHEKVANIINEAEADHALLVMQKDEGLGIMINASEKSLAALIVIALEQAEKEGFNLDAVINHMNKLIEITGLIDELCEDED